MTTSKPKPGARKFTGVDRSNYEDAKTICSLFSPRKVAGDLGVQSADPMTAAEALAKDYRLTFRQAVLEGCLAGFRKRGDIP